MAQEDYASAPWTGQPAETDQQIIARQRRLIDQLQKQLNETELELCQLREESSRQVNDLLDEVRKLREESDGR